MNNTLLEALIGWPKPFIKSPDIRLLLGRSLDACKGIIKRAVHEGYLLRLRQGLYLIKMLPNKPLPNKFELAQQIYGPSYISFESALSYAGWIPEAVVVTCSACIKQTKEFRTHLGTFTYEKIPNSIFNVGVSFVKENESSYLIADPWKAIADMIYFRNRRWKSIHELSGDLRIEMAEIETSNKELLQFLSKHYPHALTQKILIKFYSELIDFLGENDEY